MYPGQRFTMPISVLPDIADLVPVNWNIRYLAKYNEMIPKLELKDTLPMLRLLEIYRDGFVDGASISSPDEIARSSVPPPRPTFLSILFSDAGSDSKEHLKEKLIYDHVAEVSYLMLPLWSTSILYYHDYALVLWRHGRIFSPDDVVTAKIILQLYFNRVKECHRITPSPLAEDPNLTVRCTPKILNDALNHMEEASIFLSGQGKCIGLNRMVELLFGNPIKEKIVSGTINEWLSDVCHPDDCKLLLETWSNAKSSPNKETKVCINTWVISHFR